VHLPLLLTGVVADCNQQARGFESLRQLFVLGSKSVVVGHQVMEIAIYNLGC